MRQIVFFLSASAILGMALLLPTASTLALDNPHARATLKGLKVVDMNFNPSPKGSTRMQIKAALRPGIWTFLRGKGTKGRAS